MYLRCVTLLLVAAATVGCPEPQAPTSAEGQASKLCPEGARLFGAAPPEGSEQSCRIQTKGGLWINHGPSWKYHASGKKAEEQQHQNGRPHGAYTRWDGAGFKIEAGEYSKGEAHGVWTRWDPTGKVKDRRRYDRGRVALLGASPQAAPEAAAEEPLGAKPAYDSANLFCWKVTNPKKRGKRAPVVYLLGSIHVGHYGVFPMDQTIEDAFDGSGTLAIEARPSKKDRRWQRKYFRKQGRLRSGTTLKDVVDEDLWAPLVRSIEENGLNLDDYTRFKPWVLASVIGGLKSDALKVDGRYGIDNYFLARAWRGDKKVIGLESYRAHVKIFDTFPLKTQNLMLRDALRSAEAMDKEFRAIKKAWDLGDPQELDRVYLAPLREDPAQALYFDKLIVRRNREMAQTVKKFLKRKRGSLFAIAGAAHMAGEEGIPAILKRKGLKVEQLLRHGL